MTTHAPDGRMRLLPVLRAGWVFLISALAVVDHVALSRLMQDVQANDQRSQAAAGEKLAAVVARLDTISRQPIPVSETMFAIARDAFEERLTRLEQANGDNVRASDLAPLQDHLHQLESRIARVRRSPPAPSPPPSNEPPPEVTEPPFTLLGTELRGGEQFLVLAPAGSDSLAQVRVLRIGETAGDWRLESLDGNAAVFRIDGRLRRIELP
jgi:hypothetical protein